MMKRLILFLSSLFLISGYAEITQAIAEIRPTQGNQAKGRVIFQKENDGIRIIAEIEGLKPGVHGFHIHEKGDCSSPDASSAGAHFNPTKQPHNSPYVKERHIGDLGNIIADKQGRAYYERVDYFLTFDGPNSIIEKAVIVHSDPDDYVTQPTGNAGGRLGCGVIKATKR